MEKIPQYKRDQAGLNILINSITQKIGGGVQVALSIIEELKKYPENNYIIVCSPQIYDAIDINGFEENFVFYAYSFSLKDLITSKYLNGIVIDHQIDKVFTVFGPAYWKPRVPHLCGYARPQYIYKSSPFFSLLSRKEKIKLYFKERIHLHYFAKADMLFTENADVSQKLAKILLNKNIFTVTNYYNQIFEKEALWENNIDLGHFDGVTLMTIAVNYPHKNLRIIPEVIREIKKISPDFKFRFVVTITPEELRSDKEIMKHIVFIGKVKIEQCPGIYRQSDIMFLPTLLECFSASYPEAMYMEVPIITSDLDFARGLCGEAAIYADPLDAQDIAQKIISLSNSPETMGKLKAKGKQQLLKYDNYKVRAKKLLDIIYETNNTRP